MAATEKRSGPRISVDAAATLQVLGAAPGTNSTAFPVRIVDVSQRGMRLHSGVQFQPGEAIKLEMGESMFLGEVCYCAAVPGHSTSAFYIGIVTEQCLTGLSGLQHLITALDRESERKLERV